MMRAMAATATKSAMSLPRRALHVLAIATPVFFCMGNSCADDFLGTGTTTNDAGMVVSVAGPQLEITVDGVHVGPLALEAGSYANFIDSVGGIGESSDSDLTIYAVTSESSFALHVSVFGADVQPIHAASYAIETALGTQTDDGAVSLSGVPTVTAGQVTLECDDGTCGGAALTITELDSTQVAGYLSATMANTSDGSESIVVTTFVVPWQTYSP
jgi:hypothetical protein